jgi:cobyrinic acid a,c-diamide synthase
MNDSSSCPAVLIAAPASGQGKTTVAAALARLHVRRGRRVRAFKCGPDFLDPLWLGLATGAPVHNLDLWMTGEADIRDRLHAAAVEADLIVIEGVMGLFDGEPSAADLAQRLGLPVLVVIDASAMAGTFGALAFGLSHYRPGLRWAGVLANRVAGEAHAQMLQDSLGEGATSGWLGALLRNPACVLPERHLGLTAVGESPDALARLDAAADALAETPLGRMTDADWQAWAVDFSAPVNAAPAPRLLAGRTVAVARDAAFSFIYPANLDALRSLGAELVFFSPLDNDPLPACDAVWLPGGYPELHAAVLACTEASRDSLRAHVQAGLPVWAECGGMMVLFDELIDRDGQAHAGWGLLPGRVRMGERLAALGPHQLGLAAGSLRGHSFHYSRCETELAPALHTESVRGGVTKTGEAVYQHGALRASYFHAWFASNLAATAALFDQKELP